MLQELPPRNEKEKEINSFAETFAVFEAPSESHLTRLLGFPGHTLLSASLADLVGTNPLALDRPGAEALVVGVVASEVAVFYQTAAGVPAREVNDFILAVCQHTPEREILVLGKGGVPGT